MSADFGFFGNPNITITAINTGGGITCSRTSGNTPCFVQVSASAITATGTSRPYEDLEYTWDFGDPSGIETFNQPIEFSGQGRRYNPTSVNMNNCQIAPEAAYCYRNAGSYTVTLNIRGKNGSNYTTAQATVSITVTAFDAISGFAGHRYIDSVNGLDSNDGLTPATAKQSLSAIQAFIAAKRWIHLARGSHWTQSTGTYTDSMIKINNGANTPIRFDAYGSGAKPIFEVNAADAYPLVVDNSSNNPDDVVVTNLVFLVSGTATVGISAKIDGEQNATNNISNVYLDNCDLQRTVISGFGGLTSIGQAPFTNNPTNLGIWGGNYTNSLATNGGDIGIYSGARFWNFFVGFSISGAGVSDTASHHIYSQVKEHSLTSFINFGSGPMRNNCIKGGYNAETAGEFQQWICISDCYMTGTHRAVGIADYSNGSLFPTEATSYVIQRNCLYSFDGDGKLVPNTNTCVNLTLRHNISWGMTASTKWYGFFNGSDFDAANMSGYLYGNYLYQPIVSDGGGGHYAFDFSFTPTVSNTWVQQQVITDNAIYSTASGVTIGKLMNIPFADFSGSGSIVDRNIYYAPNVSGNFLNDFRAGVSKTFAQWQAGGWDLNGANRNPNWVGPQGGDFREGPLGGGARKAEPVAPGGLRDRVWPDSRRTRSRPLVPQPGLRTAKPP